MKNKIFRFEFDEPIKNEIDYFSKLHRLEDRKTFKENFDKWFYENNEIIMAEKRRIHNLGYQGDIKEKIFVSCRYYFRKKPTQNEEEKNDETKITKRNKYIKINHDILDEIDIFIKSEMDKNDYFKPKEKFIEFCKLNVELLKKIIKEFKNNNINDSKDIENKVKKIFKNRFQFLQKKSSENQS